MTAKAAKAAKPAKAARRGPPVLRRLLRFYGVGPPNALYPDVARFALERSGSHVVLAGFSAVAVSSAWLRQRNDWRPVADAPDDEDLSEGWAWMLPLQRAAVYRRVQAEGWERVVVEMSPVIRREPGRVRR